MWQIVARSLLMLVSLFALPAFADKCVLPIVDEVNVLSSADQASIEKEIAGLSALGADVHVHILSSMHRNADGNMMKSLGEYKMFMQGKCPTWQAPDRGFKNNLVFVAVVPKKGGSAPYALFYGKQWEPKLQARFNSILDDMEGRFRQENWAAGIAIGLNEVNDLVSIKQSQAGKPVTIIHEADSSWKGHILGWLLALGALAGLIVLAIFALRKKGEGDTAQMSAQTERNACSGYLNGFVTPFAALQENVKTANVTAEWRVYLNGALDDAQAAQKNASREFNNLNNSANNPDSKHLPSAAYEAMARRYASVKQMFMGAQALRETASAALKKALRGEPIPTVQSGKVEESLSTPNVETERVIPTVAGGKHSSDVGHGTLHTDHRHEGNRSSRGDRIVVANQGSSGSDLLTGVVIGSMLGRDHERVVEREIVHDVGAGGYDRSRHNDGPVIADVERDAPSYGGERVTTSSGDGGGGERTVSLSGDGGGGERNNTYTPPASEGRSGTSY